MAKHKRLPSDADNSRKSTHVPILFTPKVSCWNPFPCAAGCVITIALPTAVALLLIRARHRLWQHQHPYLSACSHARQYPSNTAVLPLVYRNETERHLATPPRDQGTTKYRCRRQEKLQEIQTSRPRGNQWKGRGHQLSVGAAVQQRG